MKVVLKDAETAVLMAGMLDVESVELKGTVGDDELVYFLVVWKVDL